MRNRGQRFVSNSTDLKPATHKIKPFAMVWHIFISQKMVNWSSMMASPLIIPRNYAVFIATIWSNLPLPKTNFTVQWSNAIKNIILEHKHTVLLQPTFLMKLQNRKQLSTNVCEIIFNTYFNNIQCIWPNSFLSILLSNPFNNMPSFRLDTKHWSFFKADIKPSDLCWE